MDQFQEKSCVSFCLNEMVPLVQINIWSYTNRRLLHSVETGHIANIFCTKFVPETSDELVVSGAGDAEVNLFFIFYFFL